MAKLRDFGIFWFFWTIVITSCTVLALFVINKYENSFYQDRVTELEKEIAQCEFKNNQVMQFDSEIKRSLERLIENSAECYKNFFNLEKSTNPLSEMNKK